jgi:hypothetical protein
MKNQPIEKQLVQDVRKSHAKAQELADETMRTASLAVAAALEAGRKLAEAKKHIKPDVYAAWLEGTFGEEFATKWAPKYTSMAKQLEFNLDNPDPWALKKGMTELELIPHPPHEAKPRAEVIKTWETEVTGWANKFGNILSRAPQGWRPFLKAQMRELWTWLKTDLFKDELEAR